MRCQGMNVLRVEGRDEGGIQPLVDLVDDGIGLFFGGLDLVRRVGQVSIARLRAFDEKVRGAADELYLLLEVLEKLLFTGKQFHDVEDYLRIRCALGSIERLAECQLYA